ncbi:MAG: diadenylate cyclase CdaA [Verrucomicrobiota bacterium]|nr:diadenylate cyclase CdaA [Verrucomicrobiota bacterium]
MHAFSSLSPFIEIAIIAIMIDYLLSFFWNTKSIDLIFGFFAFLFILVASTWFHLPVLHRIMVLIGNVLVLAIIIIFQPELRVALSKLSLKSKRGKGITDFDRFLDQLASSVFRMSERKMGAIIAMENKDSLDDYAQKAVLLDSQFSPELLETIFSTSTPLHDGAVLMRDKTLLAAAVILPLAEDSLQLAKSMGTRHRAALGLSQATDALVIVISEETGKISIAREGIMTRGVKIDRFKGILRSIFSPPEKQPHSQKKRMMEWFPK